MAIDEAAVAKKEAALRGDDHNLDSMSAGVDGAGETKLKPRRSMNHLLSPRTPATPPLSPDPSIHDCSDEEETSLSTSSPSQLQQRQMDEDEEETKRYNSYWYIHGNAYDLAPFISTHPGGEHALLLARGRDGTSLFESYHPFSQKPKEVLKKYIVRNPNKAQLARHVVAAEASGWVMGKEDLFWEALKRRCGAALQATGTASIAMPWSYFIFGICLIILQWYLYFNVFLHNGSALGGVALGAVSWMVVGMYGHEGLHYGISRKFPLINLWLGGYAMSWMSNPFIWTLQHTYAHHSFTNNHELDPDTRHFAIMLRMHKANSYRHRLHPFLIYRAYVYMFWSQTVLGMTVLLPIKALLFQSVQGTTPLAPYTKLSTSFWIGLHFVAYYLVLWVMPYLHNISFFQTSLNFACYQTTIGFLFGVFSQATHLTTHSMQAHHQDDHDSPRPWAQAQVETAANFSQGSIFWNLVSGGLNLQIEHHLFPGLSHSVLRTLTPVIRETCKDFNIPFKSYPTFADLLTDVHEYFSSLSTPVVVEKKKLR